MKYERMMRAIILLSFIIIHYAVAKHDITVSGISNLTTYRGYIPNIQVHALSFCRGTIQSDDVTVVGIFEPNTVEQLYSWSWSDDRPGLHSLELRAVCQSRVSRIRFIYTILHTGDTDQSEWGLPPFSWQQNNRLNDNYACTTGEANHHVVLNLPRKRLPGHPVPIAIQLMTTLPSGENSLFRTKNAMVSLSIECTASSESSDIRMQQEQEKYASDNGNANEQSGGPGGGENEDNKVQTTNSSITATVKTIHLRLQRGTATTVIDSSYWKASTCSVHSHIYYTTQCSEKETEKGQNNNNNKDAVVVKTYSENSENLENKLPSEVHLPPIVTSSTRVESGSLVRVNALGLIVDVGSRGIVELCGPTVVLVPSGANLEVVSGTLKIGSICKGSKGQIYTAGGSSMITSTVSSMRWGGILVKNVGSAVRLFQVHVIQSAGVNKFTEMTVNGESNSDSNNEHCANVPPIFEVHGGGVMELDYTFVTGGSAGLRNPRGIVALAAACINVSNSILSHLAVGINAKDTKLTVFASTLTGFSRAGSRNAQRLDDEKENDHDGMYIVGGETLLNMTTVSEATDDCIDSGTGAGGKLQIFNTFIERCSHEGIAISDNGWGVAKHVIVRKSSVSECQQGVELGFSTHLLLLDIYDVKMSFNVVGLRIGDNYGWETRGHVRCVRCHFESNTLHDVWNLHRASFEPLKHRLQLVNSQTSGMFHSSDALEDAEQREDTLYIELERGAVRVPFAFRQKYTSIASMEWSVAESCDIVGGGCTLAEYEKIIMTLREHCIFEEDQDSWPPENHIMVLWSKVPHDTMQDIHSLLISGVTGLTVVEKRIISGRFDGRINETFFHQFYSHNPYTIQSADGRQITMSEHKGIGPAVVYLLLDTGPIPMRVPGKGTVSHNIYTTKHQLRAWLPGKFQLHASQTVDEAQKDWKFLFNSPLPTPLLVLNNTTTGVIVHDSDPQYWWPPSPVSGARDPLYMSWQVNVRIDSPKSGQVFQGGDATIRVEWSLEMFDESMAQLWEKREHGRKACITITKVRNDSQKQVQNDQEHFQMKNDCVFDPHPTFRNLPPGSFVIAVWLVAEGRSSTIEYLTVNTTVRFEVSPLWSLKEVALETSANVVIGAALEAEWPSDHNERKRLTEITYGAQLSKVVIDPDYRNEWENVLRASMHGRHLPILASLPFDILWYKTNASVHHIGNLRTLNERSWSTDSDGATRRCARVRDNYFSIAQAHCGVRDSTSPKLLQSSGQPTHSAHVLSMMSQVSSLSKILVAVGENWNDLTLWDGNHRGLAFYGTSANGARAQSVSKIPGCNIVMDLLTNYTLYVGISRSLLTAERGHFCI
jgi:hypothetical protein